MMNVINIEQLRAKGAALEDLDQWDSTITQLNLALTDAAVARVWITDATVAMDLEEARAILAATDGNAEQRKATVTLNLAENAAYQKLVSNARATAAPC